MAQREIGRWSRRVKPGDDVVPAEHGLVEVHDGDEYDAETVAVDGEQLGEAVDPPDEPRTVYGTLTASRDHERAPIVPAWMRSKSERRQFAGWALDFAWYSTRFHTWRFFTKYLWLSAFWAIVGVFRVAGRQLRWWWLAEQYALRQNAASQNDPETWHKLHRHAQDVRKFRGIVLGVELLALAVTITLLFTAAPAWAKFVALALATPALARMGRPEDKPILDRVTLGQRFVKLTAEQVRAALCTLGISAIKEPSQLKFPQDIHRDGPGWLARVNLPPGVEVTDVLERRGKLSSALRLPIDQVWPSAGPEHEGQLDLWVGFQPASKMGQPKWSLASSTARTSVFEPQEFGTDQRQRPVKTVLFARNFLLGGQPGSGKSYAARTLAFVALLDPTCEVKIAEHKGTADFGDMAPLCSSYVCGVDDESFAESHAILTWGLAEAERRGKRIAAAKARGDAPEGKVTPELAARSGSGLHPVMILIDEAHELFGDDDHGKSSAKKAERLIKRGRALNIFVVLSTQIPDKDSLPPIITRCVNVRWCLAVADQVANDMVLGTGAYKRGLSAAVYRPGADAGWGIMTGIEQAGPVRSHFPDTATTAAMIDRATELRGGRVVGAKTDAIERRDILADVLHVMSDRGDHWEILAAKLAALDPAYSGWTPEMVSMQLRQLEVPSVDIKIDGVNRKGARREAITEAIDRRTLTAG